MNKLTLLLALTAVGLVLLIGELVLKDPRPSTVPSGNERGTLIKDLKPRFMSVWSHSPANDKRVLELAASVEQRDEEHCIVQEAKKRSIAPLEHKIVETPPTLGISSMVGGVWVGVGDNQLFDIKKVTLPPEVTAKASEIRALGQTALIVGSDKNEFGVIGVANPIQLTNAITLKKGTVTVELLKKGNEWTMPRPEHKGRSAKEDRTMNFLKQVERAYASGPRTAKDPAKFELSTSTRTECILDGPGGKTTIYVGKNLAESGGSFAQRDANGPVLEIDNSLPSSLGIREDKGATVLDPAFFYDLKIFGDSADDAIDIAIKKGNDVTRIQKVLPGKGPLEPNQKLEATDKPIWWLTEPEGAAADEGKIRNICSTVLNLTGKSYADEIPEKDRGFDKPTAKIVIRLKDGSEREMTFGKIEGDDVLVSAKGKPDAFKVAKYVYDTCVKTDELKQKEEKKEEPEKPLEKPTSPIVPPKPAEQPKPVPVIPAPK